MRQFLCAVAAFCTIGSASGSVLAGDLGGYDERETYVERPVRFIERERIVEPHYYAPRYYYYYEPEVYYVPRPPVYRYYAAGYPHYYRSRFYYRHHYGRGPW
jgi:hypothetical protein